MNQPFQKKIEELEKELEELQLLDNFITMNPMESSDEAFEKVGKLPILESNLKLLKDLQEQIQKKIDKWSIDIKKYSLSSRLDREMFDEDMNNLLKSLGEIK